jgi:hypothetical protein
LGQIFQRGTKGIKGRNLGGNHQKQNAFENLYFHAQGCPFESKRKEKFRNIS